MIVRNSGFHIGSILYAAILALVTVVPALSSADEPDTATPSKVTANSPAVRPSVMDRHAWLQNGVPQFSAHVDRLYEAVAAGEIESAVRGARKLADVCAEGFGPDRPRTKLMRLLADSFGDLERLDPEQRKILVSATQAFLRGKTLMRENNRPPGTRPTRSLAMFWEAAGFSRFLASPIWPNWKLAPPNSPARTSVWTDC
ncbi:MAG: hypothetical protein NT069_02315 [Planctomycetota bacterium]|nr:hypothetical protein [Planctomycetota bacterium]